MKVLYCFNISVPSFQGNPIQDATLVLKIGGKQVTEHLMNLLMNGKYSFPDDNFLLWRKKKKTKFTVSSRKEIIRELKVGQGKEPQKFHFPNLLPRQEALCH